MQAQLLAPHNMVKLAPATRNKQAPNTSFKCVPGATHKLRRMRFSAWRWHYTRTECSQVASCTSHSSAHLCFADGQTLVDIHFMFLKHLVNKVFVHELGASKVGVHQPATWIRPSTTKAKSCDDHKYKRGRPDSLCLTISKK